MPLVLFDTLDDLAAAGRALPAGGALPARTVLVRSERQAHALRVCLAPAPAALAGTRFVGPLAAAEDVLHAAGVAFATGESALRPSRLARLFSSGPALRHFRAAELAATPGWDDAFSSALHALENAGLRPDDLPATPPALADLAALWRAADDEAGASFTGARLYAEAAAALERNPALWPFPGAVLAPVDGHEPAVLARFLRAVPGATLALRRARPARARWVAGVEARFGAEAGALAAARPAAAARPSTELARLQALLFLEDPSAADALGAGRGPDGPGAASSVTLEEHAGVESELDAAAAWAAREVLEHRTPLARIAVLVPVLDPLAGLVADRLERLGLAAHVAGAVPAVSTSGGARLLAVVRALRRRLPAPELAAVLPYLRIEEPASLDPGELPRGHLSHGDALALAFSLGTAGGSPARPDGALTWTVRAQERLGELGRALEAAKQSAGSDEREAWRLEATLGDLRAVRGALDALVGVARAVHANAPLDAVAGALLGFAADALLLPGGKERLLGPLAAALAPARASSLGEALRGPDALAAIETALLGLRVGRGRFGEPAVYVGTVAGAAGLSFDAVRVIGLAEGSIPSAPREDPVLPAPVRDALAAKALLRAPEDAVLAQLHALHAVVAGTRRRLVLSAPRVDLARTEREPAALFVEVAAALGRPDQATGEAAPRVPDSQALRRDAFDPARRDAAAFRRANPVGEAAWLARVAGGERGLPPRWTATPTFDPARAAALLRSDGPLGARDGILAEGGPFPVVPGLGAAKPISASALNDLLACPRRFLMSRVLGWKEPAGTPELRELDALSFGTLVHRVHELLYREQGQAIVGGKAKAPEVLARARAIADRAFDDLLLEFPLLGAKVREKQRERLHDAVAEFVEHDLRRWKRAAAGKQPGRFVDVERGFGTGATPLPLAAGGRTLHVHGFIDRLDATPDRTVVRDLKSGRPYLRQAGEAPDPGRDVQLGLYQRVARELAGAWGLPDDVEGAYVFANGRGAAQERAFAGDDAGLLAEATERWLALAGGLLETHRFPATPEEGDCGYCPFAPLCGSEEPGRAGRGLAAAPDDPILAGFLALKLGDDA
ncbi:MAG: PD-(D/E)XK nuclease family protein [Anaeromyxobacteraceae bacterium]